jgi:phosphoglycolate phosphatase-like HAD superfamily hydrolase
MAGMKGNVAAILAVDSDGCALDAMEVKHRQCFTPAIIAAWGLEACAPLVTELALKINLYSQWRGVNRFVALDMLFRLLQRRLDTAGQALLPQTPAFLEWVEDAASLSEGGLLAAIEGAKGAERAELEQVLGWTRDVNARVSRLAPPAAFADVDAALALARARGLRVYVVSSATRAAIEREWAAAGIAIHVEAFHGQEDGGKADLLRRLAGLAGDPARVLMVGDAPGDLEAARAAGCRFFPVIPGEENASWITLRDQVLGEFPELADGGAQLRSREERFRAALPLLDPA